MLLMEANGVRLMRNSWLALKRVEEWLKVGVTNQSGMMAERRSFEHQHQFVQQHWGRMGILCPMGRMKKAEVDAK